MSLTPRQLIKLASSNQAPTTTGGTWLEKKAYSEQQTPPLGAVEQQLGSLSVVWKPQRLLLPKQQLLLLGTRKEEPCTKHDRSSSETRKQEEQPGTTKDVDPSSEAGKVEDEAGIINNEPAAEQSPTAAAPDHQAATTAAPPPPTRAPSRQVAVPLAAAPVFFVDPESGILLLDELELLDLEQASIARRNAPAAPPAAERAAAAALLSMELSAAAGPVDDVEKASIDVKAWQKVGSRLANVFQAEIEEQEEDAPIDVLALALLQLMHG